MTRNWIEIWAARSEELRSDDVRILTRLTSGPRLAPQASVIQRPEQFLLDFLSSQLSGQGNEVYKPRVCSILGVVLVLLRVTCEEESCSVLRV